MSLLKNIYINFKNEVSLFLLSVYQIGKKKKKQTIQKRKTMCRKETELGPY